MYRTFIYIAFAVVALAFHPAVFADDIGGGKPESTQTTSAWLDAFWCDDYVEPESADSGE